MNLSNSLILKSGLKGPQVPLLVEVELFFFFCSAFSSCSSSLHVVYKKGGNVCLRNHKDGCDIYPNLAVTMLLTIMQNALLSTVMSLILYLLFSLVSLDHGVKEDLLGEVRVWPVLATIVIVCLHVETILTI